MIFGAEPVAQAAGGLLAHGIRGDGFSFKKGRVLSNDDVALLAAAGWDAVVVARLEPEESLAHNGRCGPGCGTTCGSYQ